ncbi:hypothetical protein GCK32_013645 [Trichostrongylus colubriformis]|uniref:Uncharacterized protein n=1 Tax=Trichostrongylus colubriformis TaxID=6319 RepID=A0AAN8IEW1_TRICO
MLLRDFVPDVILWICVTTIYFPVVEAMACYELIYRTYPELEEGTISRENFTCCEVFLEFNSFEGYYYVEDYHYAGNDFETFILKRVTNENKFCLSVAG